jgi:hypothetical protein
MVPPKYVLINAIKVLAVVGNKLDKTDDEEVPYNDAK